MADATKNDDNKKRYTNAPKKYWASTLVAVQGPEEGARTILWVVDVTHSPWAGRYVVRFGYTVNNSPRKGWTGTVDQYREELKPVMPLDKNSPDPQVRKLVETIDAARKVAFNLNNETAQRAEAQRQATDNRKARDAAQARAKNVDADKAAKRAEKEAKQAKAIHDTAVSAASSRMDKLEAALSHQGEFLKGQADTLQGILEHLTGGAKADDEIVLPEPEPGTDPTDAPDLPAHFLSDL